MAVFRANLACSNGRVWMTLAQIRAVSVVVLLIICPCGGGGGEGGEFEHICSCHNFFSLSSVQILLLPACCFLCVL